MIEDNPEHVWVRVDPVIETLLGLEPGALTENPEVAPYPTRLAPEGTSWLVLIPPRVLEGRVWVGSEAAIDRLMVSRKRKRAQVSRYIRAGEYPRRLAPTGVTWQVGIPADTPLSPLRSCRRPKTASGSCIRSQDSKSRRSILSRSSLPPSLLEPGCPAIREGQPSPSGPAEFRKCPEAAPRR